MPDRRKDLEDQLVEKAAQDPAFKALLLSDPHKALAALGFALPPNLTVEVLQETGTRVYLVLPPEASPAAEITDQELEDVSGGAWSNDWAGSYCCG